MLLLDEPTKGLDAYAKAELAQLLQELCREGTSILIVTHDVEFAARYATGCALMFDGLLLSEGEPTTSLPETGSIPPTPTVSRQSTSPWTLPARR